VSFEIKVATVAMNVVYDKKRNLEKYMKFIDEAVAKGAKLIVFPEQSLQGYLYNLASALNLEYIRYVHDNAEFIPEGESTQALVKNAREKDIYIIWGMTERDKNAVDLIYNSAVLVGPEGYIGTYRKVHQPLDEKHVFYPGEDWPVFRTNIGRIGMMICYDKCFPESARELALGGAEIIVLPTAWPLMSIGSDLKTDHLKRWYDLADCMRAAENQVWYIASNQIGTAPKSEHDFLGHSRIIDPYGIILADTGYKEDIVMAEIGVQQGLIEYRATIFGGGYNFYLDRKPQLYKRISTIKHSQETYKNQV